ncbi:MAG TPA: hypothetical protein VFE77_05580 [Rhodanobacter sp.]|nr:hypothetical protein [Rhodanobacter sp.]
MHIQRFLPVLLATLLTTAAWAQTAEKPLNLKLPPGNLPASSSSVAAASTANRAPDAGHRPASSGSVAAASPASSAPGVYYGDTSGRMGNTEVASDTRPACDDSTYNQPQVHGSVGMGVMAGNHVSGNYQTGSVSVSRAFGSCDDPHGGVSFSISSGTGNFHGRGH